MKTHQLSGSLMTRRAFLRRNGYALGIASATWLAATPHNTVRAGVVEQMPEKYALLLERLRTPHKFPELVLKPSFKKGAFDALGVDAPFVFKHKRRYLMTYIGFDGTGYRTGIAWSKDLVKWEKDGIFLDRGPVGSPTEFNVALTWIIRDNALFGEGELKQFDGKFIGTYHAYPNAGYEAGPASIGICRSKDLHKWDLKDPVFHATDPDAGEWEKGGLYKSCIVEHKGVFYMFYNAKTADTPWIEQIGLATSTDLKKWTRFEDNPIIPVGSKGAFDDIFCSDPCVLHADGTWIMFFYTLGSDGRARESVAFSDDLLHWRKSDTILIDVGAPGSIDATYAHKPAIFALDGTLYHYYCAVSPPIAKTMGEVEVHEIRGIALARP